MDGWMNDNLITLMMGFMQTKAPVSLEHHAPTPPRRCPASTNTHSPQCRSRSASSSPATSTLGCARCLGLIQLQLSLIWNT